MEWYIYNKVTASNDPSEPEGKDEFLQRMQDEGIIKSEELSALDDGNTITLNGEDIKLNINNKILLNIT